MYINVTWILCDDVPEHTLYAPAPAPDPDPTSIGAPAPVPVFRFTDTPFHFCIAYVYGGPQVY